MTDEPQWRIHRVGLLSTGSEILQGQYADTNAQFLAEKLTLAGVQVVTIVAAPDDETAIEQSLKFAGESTDLVICTGGLGPTQDDVNRFVFARVFQTELVRDENAVQQMSRRFLTRGQGRMPEANEVQAMLPRNCIPFYNRWGTAPGFLLRPAGGGELGHCGLLALPGPPSEMVPMWNEAAWPALQPYLTAGRVGAIRTIHTFGYPESHIGTLVADLFARQPGVEFSILAKRHGVDLRICATGETHSEVQNRLTHYEEKVKRLLEPRMVYGLDDEMLSHVVGAQLKARSAWVTTAESCTGGLVAQMLTDVAGSSAYVGECHVTYSNEAKVRVLGVRKDTLDAVGAVSHDVAVEMAEGARRVSGADFAVSITGIAGPGGGTDEKPVGLTYISVAGPGGTTTSKNIFMGDRSGIRNQAALTALNMLRLILLESHN